MTKLPIPESYWVEENRFLAGGYPGAYDPETTRRRLDAFLEAGINTFIDLTQAHELIPYEDILQEQAQIYTINAEYHRFAIHDFSIPSAKTMTDILDTIDETISKGGCVYAHCWGGVGRTGLVVGCYLVRHGYTNVQALAEVDRLFKTRPDGSYHQRSPESNEQIDFILNWWDEPKNNQQFCEG
jgi:protein-tyrosine phosphatase